MTNEHPEMNYVTFDEFEAYAEAVEDTNVQFTLPRLQRDFWSLRNLQVGPIHLQLGHEGSGSIAEGSVVRGGALLYFEAGGPHSRTNGIQMAPDSVFLVNAGAEMCISNPGEQSWCSLWIPDPLSPTVPFSGARLIRNQKELVRELRSLVGRLVSSADVDPSVLTQPASLNAFQSELGRILRRLVASRVEPSPSRGGRPSISRRALIQRVIGLSEDSSGLPLPVNDLAKEVGVSDRTLRSAFLEYYGVTPRRYLELQRLHRARGILRDAEVGSTNVGKVAALFGFWDFSRFARKYYEVFGELPSETLRGD